MIDDSTVNSFTGDFHFLSNFYQYPVRFDRMWFKSSEAAFAAAKTLSRKERVQIAEAETPADAKRLGRSVSLRLNWELIKDEIMWQVLCSKFSNESISWQLILVSGLDLVEGNTWHDNEWGNCTCGRTSCQNIGKNKLGKMLMLLSKELGAGRDGLSSDRPWLNRQWNPHDSDKL